MQAAYATDIIFKRKEELGEIYEHLVRTAIPTVTPENMATFPGKKYPGNYKIKRGNRFNIRRRSNQASKGTRLNQSI